MSFLADFVQLKFWDCCFGNQRLSGLGQSLEEAVLAVRRLGSGLEPRKFDRSDFDQVV